MNASRSSERAFVFTVALLALAQMSAVSFAWALDCSLARTETEKAVCASPELTQADRKLNTLYRAWLASQPPDEREKIKQAQRVWIKENDTDCRGDANCLGKRYADRIADLVQNARPASPSAVSGSIRSVTVTVKKMRSYEQNLSYPKFEGEPKESVSKLNRWVRDHIPTCDGNEKNNAHSYVNVSMRAPKLTNDVAVIEESGESFCQGNAHPNHGLYTHFLSVRTGAAVDLWEALPEPGRQAVIQRIVAAGKDIPADDDCKELFSLESLKESFVTFDYKNERTFGLRPDFPHAVQACDDRADASIAIDELAKFYPAQSAASLLLEGLLHN
jgi:uncharacterized protein